MADYIKREDALDALTADALERNLDSVMTDTASRYHRAAQRVVNIVPAADVHPVARGRWIKETDEADLYVNFVYLKCSLCGNAYNGIATSSFHFCPNCGADMRGVDND